MDQGNKLRTDFTLSEKDKNTIDAFKKQLPKYKRIRYREYICFSQSSGIGLNVEFRREYTNGKVFKLDISDYNSW